MKNIQMHPLYNEVIKILKGNKIKVLYVDDDELIRIQVKKVLSNFVDKNLFFAENGKEALEIFKQESPSIIMTDINLPTMNGFKLLDSIKESISLVEYYQLAIGIVTGFEDNLFLLKAIEANVDGYLLKPLQFDIFLELFFKLVVKAINMKDAMEYNAKLEKDNIEDGFIKEELRKKIEELEREQRYSKMKNLFIAKDRAKDILDKNEEVDKKFVDDWFKPSNRKDDKIVPISELVLSNNSLDYPKDLIKEISNFTYLASEDEQGLNNYISSIHLFVRKLNQNTIFNSIIERATYEVSEFCGNLQKEETKALILDSNRAVLIGYLEMLSRELEQWLESIENFGIGSKEEIVRTDMLIITIRQFDEFLKSDKNDNIEDIFF